MYTKVPTIGTGTIDTCMSGHCHLLYIEAKKLNIIRIYLYWVDNLSIPPLGVYKTPPGEVQMEK